MSEGFGVYDLIDDLERLRMNVERLKNFWITECGLNIRKDKVKQAIKKINEEHSDSKYACLDYPGAEFICAELLKELGLE